MRTGACDYCGGEFVDRSPAQRRRFCSDRCRRDNFAKNPLNRKVCEQCGAPTGQTPKPTAPRLCDDCYRDERREPRVERAYQIEAWWAEGLSLYEIAAKLGWTRGTTGGEISRLRDEGFDLPHRYAMDGKRRVAA